LIDGVVVGVEKTPSSAYWLGVWEALIRECYGSLAMEYRRQMGEKPNRMSRNYIRMSEDVSSIEDLEMAFEAAIEKEEELVRTTIRDLLNEPFSVHAQERVNKMDVETVRNKQFYGQVIREGDYCVYASLVCNEDWLKEAKRSGLSEFSI